MVFRIRELLTEEGMALIELVEKQADGDLVRDMRPLRLSG